MNQTHNPIIVGLDIGTTKVVAIAGKKNEFGKLEILGFGKAESSGVQHGVVMNIEHCVRSIQNAMKDLLQSNPNLDIHDVYVGIAGHHIKSLQTRGDRIRSSANDDDVISRTDLELLIQDQMKTCVPAGDQIIDIIPQDFVVDNTPNVREPIGMSGVKIGANFHIVTGDRNAIKNIKRCVEKSDLNPIDLVLQPIASAAAVMSEDDLEAGVAIVDIGGGTTDVAVFHDGILMHTAVIPFAGSNVTEDIRQGLGVLRNQAEAMKVQFGTVIAREANPNAYITIPGLRGLRPKEISVSMLANIIEARVSEIIDFVIFQLKQHNLVNKLHGGIIITGGGSMMKHIVQLFEFKTGLSTRIGSPNVNLAGGHSDELAHPMYATCVGLILRGYSDYEAGKKYKVSGNQLHIIEPTIATPIPNAVNYVQQPINRVAKTIHSVADLEEEVTVPEAKEEPVVNEAPVVNQVEETNTVKEEQAPKKSGSKKSEAISRIFGSIKTTLISIFEDVEDKKI